jgi:hypothetical protein
MKSNNRKLPYHELIEKIRENDRLWVIPSMDTRLPQPMTIVNREIIRYWMIELTLTSGAVQKFYVKAKDRDEATKIGKGYSYLQNNPKLRTDRLVLRPSTEKIDREID